MAVSMLDVHHAKLAITTLGSLLAFLLVMDAYRHAHKRGALGWRRGRVLHEARYPGSYRLGLSLMQSAGLIFAFGAVRGATALLDMIP